MFLRSVFLTMDACMEGSGNPNDCRFQHAAVFFPTSKFFSWFLHLRRRVCYLALLVSSISVDTLTLENVSCLNTALIILMLAARQGTLASCLKMLATATIEQLKLGIYYIKFHEGKIIYILIAWFGFSTWQWRTSWVETLSWAETYSFESISAAAFLACPLSTWWSILYFFRKGIGYCFWRVDPHNWFANQLRHVFALHSVALLDRGSVSDCSIVGYRHRSRM